MISSRCFPALLAVLAGCGRGEASPTSPRAADLLVSVRADKVEGPDSIGPGWTHVRVEEDGKGHILVLFRLSGSAPDLGAFLTALDTAAATPRGATALGGPEVGDTGEVVLQLTPGRYLFGCVRRAQNGHRHASLGETKVLLVTGGPVAAGRTSPPASTGELKLVDFAYLGPDTLPAGAHMLRVENAGTQDHQLRLARLRTGASVQDWMKAPNPNLVAPAVAGVARMGPGAVAYLPVELSVGTYVAYCLVTDPASGREHIQMGMLRTIQVR